MKHLVVALTLVVFSCSSGSDKPDEPVTDGATIDCSNAETLKMITFCASPQAAELAVKNAEIKDGSKVEEAFSPLPIGNSPTIGEKDALVTIVMFSDLQCPFCQQAHHVLKKLAKDRDVRIVFKHAPLPFHQDAVPAAFASLIANDQGKFWEFAELAYANQNALSQEDLKKYAQEVGVDVSGYDAAFGSEEHMTVVQNDINLARNAGVEATPTIFVNGLRIVGLYPEEQMASLIDMQIGYAQKLVDAGVAREDVHWRLVSVNYSEPEIIAEEPVREEKQVVAMVPIVDAPVKGANAEDALVTIVEFSDFECSYCRKAQLWLDSYMKENSADVRLVYRHFPLPFHENADIAAAASIVAQQKGKFWDYHDLLFANQDRLGPKDLIEHAKKVRISKSQLRKLQGSDAVIDHLKNDIEIAQALGVQGTPTFFINGIMFVGVPVDDTLPNLIAQQRELAKKIAAEQGLKGDELYEAIVKANQDAFK